MIRGVIFFAAVTLVAALSFGATIHVPSQQPTIQAGINAASNGDTVLVAPGTYTERLVIDSKTVSVISEQGDALTRFVWNGVSPSAVVVKNGANLTFAGFTWRDQSGAEGITIEESSLATIKDNTFRNLSMVSSSLIRGVTAGPCTVSRNVFKQITTPYMVYFDGGSAVQITNNTIDSASYGGVLTYQNGSVVENNIFRRCQAYGFYPNVFTVTEKYNCYWQNAHNIYDDRPLDATDIVQDPQFANAPTNDYHLQATSPCINSGDPATQYNDPNGTRNDIGAYPFGVPGPDVWIGSIHYPSIQSAIDAANPNATVVVGEGIAYEHLTIEKPLTLVSQFGADSTTIDGQNLLQDTTNSVISVINADSVTIDGLTLRGGRGLMQHDSTNARGGGIYVQGSLSRIRNCRIIKNTVGPLDYSELGWGTGGAGLFADTNSALSVESTVFDSCRVTNMGYTATPHLVAGGGILAFCDSTNLTNCLFNYNLAQADFMSASGGAIALLQGFNYIENCDFNSNQTISGADGEPQSQSYIGHGGTIAVWGDYNQLNDISIKKSKLLRGADYGNATLWGGGIFMIGDWQTMNRVSVVGSKISSDGFLNGESNQRVPTFYVGHSMLGGAAYVEGNHLLLSQCRFDSTEVYNMATATGGGAAYLNGGGIYLKGSGQFSESQINYTSGSLYSGGYQGGYSTAVGVGCYAEGNIQISLCMSSFNSIFCLAEAYAGPAEAHCKGGGFALVNGPVILNVIATGNNLTGQSTDSMGGVLLLGSGVFDSIGSTVGNSDLWNNSPTNYFGGNWTPGTNGNISADPQFCFPDTGNFYLKASSPCAAGNHVSGQTVGAFDVGCYGADMVKSLGLADGALLGNVVSQMPKYGWKAFYHPSYTQAKFEIAVGTDNDWQYSEMWNPAPFISSDTFVTYAGAPLVDGQTYYLRLRISDGVSWSNWYYTSFHMNTPPTVPVPYAPQWPNITVSTTPDLSVVNATDAENDTLAYDFEVYYDSMLTQLAVASPHVAETHNPDSTSWTVTPPLTDNKYYYWRARAFDGYEYSPWSSMRYFIADNVNEPPNQFTLLDPPDSTGSILYNRKPTFRWTYTGDPDPYNQVRYKLELAVDPAFTFKQVIDSLYTSFWIPPDSLPYHSHHWWRVAAIDQHGATTFSPNVKEFWVWTLGDVDHSNNVDIADLSRLIDYLYISFGPIVPRKVGDLDGDCTVDIADLSRMIDYLYLSLIPLDIGGCGP